MIINDLFSHKLHSSSDAWPQKLIDIATVFSRFDGQLYDRNVIEQAFRQISPRASIVSREILSSTTRRDLSKYRDEISAYPAYLGLFRLELGQSGWILRLSETAKKFLIVEEPNVPAFLLLQLCLFQYPNGSGMQISGSNAWVVHNARDKTLELIKNRIHLSPLRFICKALLADSMIMGVEAMHPYISIDELSVLCNAPNLNQTTCPDLDIVATTLQNIRKNKTPSIDGFERRLHLLNHTDFLQVSNGYVHLREAFSPTDVARQIKLLQLIANIDLQFTGFDNLSTGNELNTIIKQGSWGRYFDGVVQLSADVVQEIAGDYETLNNSIPTSTDGDELISDNSAIVFKYPLRDRDEDNSIANTGQYNSKDKANPEVTRIKRQKSNLTHKIIMSLLDEYLRTLGAIPKENEHIDLFAQIPNSGSFLFEIKSISAENLLSQTRKGLSQLYEYRYRYLDEIGKDVQLCLVYSKEPKEIEWLQDYLCTDRDIAIIWFDADQLCYSKLCEKKINHLVLKNA